MSRVDYKKCEPEFVIDIGEALKGAKSGLGLDDYFYIKEYQDRKHFITDVIDSVAIEDLCKAIIQYNKDDKDIDPNERKPITIYLDTPGGDVMAGLKLIDLIQCSKTPVHIVNLGICYSMGFMIYIVGHKRIASKHATFLMHDGSVSASGTASKTRDLMAFNDCVDAKLKDLVIESTKITPKLYDKKFRTEWYMFSDEAQKLGIVDEILSVDCEIEDIM